MKGMIMYSKSQLQAIKEYIWDVENALNTSSTNHFNSLGRKPAGMSEETYHSRVRAEGARLDKQWKHLRELKKQYGVK
jgi:hypothetical protein